MVLGYISHGMPLPAYKVITLWEGLLQKCSTLTGFKINCYKNAAS